MGFGIFKRSFVIRRFGEERLIDGYGVAPFTDTVAHLNVQPLSKDEIQALQAQAEELQSHLAQAKVREQELTKALEAAQQRVQQLDLRVTQLEPDAMAYAAVKERSAGVELEAHRRAQNVLDEAKLQARRVRQQTHQWLNQMVQEYNTLRRQLDAALTSAGKQLDQVGQTLSKQDGAFDQLREAYAKTDPDRKPVPTPLNDD